MTKLQRIHRAAALLCNVADELKAGQSPIDQAAASRLDEAQAAIEAACKLIDIEVHRAMWPKYAKGPRNNCGEGA